MTNYRISHPTNQPAKAYTPGSPDRDKHTTGFERIIKTKKRTLP